MKIEEGNSTTLTPSFSNALRVGKENGTESHLPADFPLSSFKAPRYPPSQSASQASEERWPGITRLNARKAATISKPAHHAGGGNLLHLSERRPQPDLPYRWHGIGSRVLDRCVTLARARELAAQAFDGAAQFPVGRDHARCVAAKTG